MFRLGDGSTARILARAVAKYSLKPNQVSAGASTFDSSSGPIRRLLLNDAWLPIRAEMATGEVLRWDYSADPSDATPPPFEDTGALEHETYRELTPEGAASHLGLATVPEHVAGLPLETVFSYDATTARGTAYYAIWRSSEGESVQLNVVPAVTPKEALGLQQQGTALAIQEGPSQVRIVASDTVLLRSAVEALRPSSLDALSVPVGLRSR